MRISIKLEASESTGHRYIDLDDLGISPENWEAMTEQEKRQAIDEWVIDLPEHPYWCLDSFSEE